MKITGKRILLFLTLVVLLWGFTLFRDRHTLNEGLIRFHVVANSDSREDQALKLLVRDAVTRELEQTMESLENVKQAKAYLSCHLEQIETLAEQTLEAAGCPQGVTVTLGQEAFDTRHYDTFSLPAGTYESLRITIGEGNGQNWWCVVFPTLCYSAAGEDWEAQAAGAGFSDTLAGALEGRKAYELRFFLLDCLGRAENFLRFG